MSINQVFLSGNLTRDPELRYTATGSPVASFTVASNKKRKEVETVAFIRCSAWGKQAEILAENARKGSPVVVTGELTTRQWTDGAGKKRETTEIYVFTVDLLARVKPPSVESSPEQEKDLDELPF